MPRRIPRLGGPGKSGSTRYKRIERKTRPSICNFQAQKHRMLLESPSPLSSPSHTPAQTTIERAQNQKHRPFLFFEWTRIPRRKGKRKKTHKERARAANMCLHSVQIKSKRLSSLIFSLTLSLKSTSQGEGEDGVRGNR